MTINIFRHKEVWIEWDRLINKEVPCHTGRLRKDSDTRSWATAINCTYNALIHIADRYRDVNNTCLFDEGDYYAMRILEAVHVLVSIGKIEF